MRAAQLDFGEILKPVGPGVRIARIVWSDAVIVQVDSQLSVGMNRIALCISPLHANASASVEGDHISFV